MRVRKPLVLAALVGAGVLGMSGPTLAAPVKSPQHAATFTVLCPEGEIVTLEATGAASFRAVDTSNGADAVIVSAEGAVYEGRLPIGEPVESFSRTWGAKAGLEQITCTRTNTDVVDGVEYTAFETFVVALLPKG